MKNTNDEITQYPGFSPVPGLKSTLINKNGVVIDTRKNWCPLPDINPDGYPCVNSDNDRQFIHRLLALTFLPKPDIPVKDLDVNHIDGIKIHNDLENLEWATRSENCFHAYRTGLRSDNVPVLVKDLRTGEVVRYYSIHECARNFNVDPTLIFHYLKSCNYGKISWNFYVLIREGDDWPNADTSQIGMHRNGVARKIAARNINTGAERVFNSMGEAARFLNVSLSLLSTHMKKSISDPFRDWLFCFMDNY